MSIDTFVFYTKKLEHYCHNCK